MTDIDPTLLGVLIGAFAGIGGAGVAALASVRASQLAARAPLAEKLQRLVVAGTKLTAALELRSGATEARLALEEIWSDFSIHQKILCPSVRLAQVLGLILKAHRSGPGLEEDEIGVLAAEGGRHAAAMIAAHSRHLLRWRATREEARILAEWIEDPDSLLSNPVRGALWNFNHPFRSRLPRLLSRRPKLLP